MSLLTRIRRLEGGSGGGHDAPCPHQPHILVWDGQTVSGGTGVPCWCGRPPLTVRVIYFEVPRPTSHVLKDDAGPRAWEGR